MLDIAEIVSLQIHLVETTSSADALVSGWNLGMFTYNLCVSTRDLFDIME